MELREEGFKGVAVGAPTRFLRTVILQRSTNTVLGRMKTSLTRPPHQAGGCYGNVRGHGGRGEQNPKA